MKQKVAVLGLGIMGHGMATNLVAKGFETVVWNRSPNKADALVKLGAKLAESPAAATGLAEVVIEIVSDDEASREVWLGPNGIMSVATPQQILIVSSSLSISWVEELAAICRQRGLTLLDAPVTGSRAGAEGGKLLYFVGGEKATLDKVQDVLLSMGSKIYHFGQSGNGMRYKLVLNLLQAIHNAGMAEALLLSKSIGLDQKQVAQALIEMGPGSPVSKLVVNRLLEPNNQVNFVTQWITKDLHYAMQMAVEAGADGLQIAKTTEAIFDRVDKGGHAKEEWTRLVEWMGEVKGESSGSTVIPNPVIR